MLPCLNVFNVLTVTDGFNGSVLNRGPGVK